MYEHCGHCSSEGVSPEEVGHVGVRAVDGTKSRQQCHEGDPNNSNTTNQLLYGQDAWRKPM